MSYAYTRPRTIDLVLADLCHRPAGTLIEDAVRSIAARIGRSAGAITPALKRLAADGWISYLADGRGTLIEVLRTDQQTDRSVCAEPPPAAADTAPTSDGTLEATDQEIDRADTALGCDQSHDRSACMDDHDSCFSSNSGMRARDEKNDWAGLAIAGAAFVPIAALEKAGQTPESVRQADAKIQTRREYTRSEQVNILFRSLLNGQPIYSAAEIAARTAAAGAVAPQEQEYGAAGAGDSSDHHSHRAEPRPSGGDRRPGTRAGASGGARRSGKGRDKYGVGAAFRDRPADDDLPPFLRAAVERSRLASSAAGAD